MDFAGRRGRGMTGGSEALGEVNGKEISYQDFSELVNALKRIKKNNHRPTSTKKPNGKFVLKSGNRW